MDNIQDDNRTTWFIDVDGTIVKHNYNPEEVADEILPGVLEKLLEIQKNAVVIITTSRSHAHTALVRKYLKSLGFVPDGVLFNLPTGKRHLVNDHTKGEDDKAYAYNVERDAGW